MLPNPMARKFIIVIGNSPGWNGNVKAPVVTWTCWKHSDLKLSYKMTQQDSSVCLLRNDEQHLGLGLKSGVDGLPAVGVHASHVTTEPQFINL